MSCNFSNLSIYKIMRIGTDLLIRLEGVKNGINRWVYFFVGYGLKSSFSCFSLMVRANLNDMDKQLLVTSAGIFLCSIASFWSGHRADQPGSHN